MDVTTTKLVTTNDKKNKKKSITNNLSSASVIAVDPTNNIVNTQQSLTACKKEKKKPKKKNKPKSVKGNNCNHFQQPDEESDQHAAVDGFGDNETTAKTITVNGTMGGELNGDIGRNDNSCHKNLNGEINCRINSPPSSADTDSTNCANFNVSLKMGNRDESHLNDDSDCNSSIAIDSHVNKMFNGTTTTTVKSSEKNDNKLQFYEHEQNLSIINNSSSTASITTIPSSTEQLQLCNKLSDAKITDDSNCIIDANNSQHNEAYISSEDKDALSPSSSSSSDAACKTNDCRSNIIITYKEYENELQMPDIMRLIQKDLSEPYSIYTYRYFIHKWPKLCFLAMHDDICVGAIVCKLDIHRSVIKRGYIAMLAVDQDYRKLKIGTNLVRKAIEVKQKARIQNNI